MKFLLINLREEEDSFKVKFKPPNIQIDNQLLRNELQTLKSAEE